MRISRLAFSLLLGGFAALPLRAQTPAFPGALGFGANATGGRFGSIYHVTTLANSGPGSLRDAASQPNRIIVFDVGGYITISSELALNDNLTIAGQTAPGGGIGIIGDEVSCGASTNLIIRHVRFRPGSAAPPGSAHCLNMYGSSNMIVDHVSFEFGPWNNIGGVNIDKVTLQNCIVANPINQQFGAHIEHLNSSCAFLYNIWANGHNRQPLATINTIYLNNTTYNYQAGFTTHTSGSFFYDIINNYFITGPATTSPGNDFYQVDSQQSIYSSGNLRDSDNNGLLGGSPTAPSGVVVLNSPWSPVTATIPTFTPATSFRINVSSAGAWPRDAVDDLVISQVKRLGSGPVGTGAGTAGPGGGLYTGQAQTGLPNGGFGVLNGGTPAADSDQDGMPDYWEAVTGSNPSVNDSMTIDPGGYAKIEKYLNWLGALHALTATNQPVDFDLWPYAGGFTNASPTYLLDNATNGSVQLVNGHVARFSPAANIAGLGNFRFVVTASDGTAYTNTVTIAISPLPPPSNLIWRGDGAANTWDAGATANWDAGASLVAFNPGDNVTFDDTGSNSPAISLAGSISAGSVSVVAAQDYTFTGGALVGANLYKVGAGTLTLNNAASFGGGMFLSEGVLQLGDGVSASGTISGNVTNNDTLILANPAAATSVANVSGSGVLIKRGAGVHTLNGTQSYTNFTVIEDGTLEFTGTPPPGRITNNAVLTFRPAAATTYAGVISGTGRVQTSGSSVTMTLSGANTFSGGINITAGNLQLAHNQAAGTGPVTNSSSGLVYVANGVVVNNDFTLTTSTTDLNMRCDSGTGTWAGNVVNLGGGASWRPGSDGGTLIFTGTANQGSRNFIVPRGSVQFASNAVISSTGSATALGRDTSGGNRSLNLTLRDNASLTLGPCSIGGGQNGNNVTVTLQNNASLTLSNNSLNLHNINRSTSVSTLRLNGGTLAVPGFTKTQATYTNIVNFNGGILKGTGLPAFANQTAYVQAGGAKIDISGTFPGTWFGAPLIHDPALGATLDGGLTKLGDGILRITNVNNTFTGPTVVLGGTLTLNGVSNAVASSTSLYVGAGATFDVYPAVMTLGSGRRLWGNGFITGDLNIGNGATLEPGSNAIGQLMFSTKLTLAPGSTSRFELNKTLGTCDSIQSLLVWPGLGGSLIVTNLSGTLVAGDTFRLFYGPTPTGSFSTAILPSLDPGLAWNIATLNTNGTISVVAVTPPVIGTVTQAGGNLIFAAGGGVPGADCYVLAGTNLTQPLSSWARIATNRFNAGGSFLFTNQIDISLEHLFYLLQLP